jgi:flagellar protein FlaG
MISTANSGQEDNNIGQDTAPIVAISTMIDKSVKAAVASSDAQGNHQEHIKEQVNNALKNINNFFQMSKRTMQFTLNEDTGRMVVEIKDEKTGEVIRQIPSEDVLQLEKKLDEFQGLLFSKKA